MRFRIVSIQFGNKIALNIIYPTSFVDINSYRVQYGRFWMPGQGFINQFWTEASGSRRSNASVAFTVPSRSWNRW